MIVEFLTEPLIYFLLGGFIFYLIGVVMNILLIYGAVKVVSKSFSDVSSRIPRSKLFGSWFTFALSIGQVSTLIEVRMNQKLVEVFKSFGIDVQMLNLEDLAKKYEEEKQKYEESLKEEKKTKQETNENPKEESKEKTELEKKMFVDELNEKIKIANEIIKAREEGDKLKEYKNTMLLRQWNDFYDDDEEDDEDE